jgi:hypothetical protein
MNITEYLRELAYPARSLGTMISFITFYLLVSLVSAAGLLGIWLAVPVVPALFRYLTMLARARARGVEAAPPGIEYFTLVGNWWTLFPAIPAIIVAVGWRLLADSYGPGAGVLFGLLAAAVVPAMMSVLVITQSPVQSLNPLALITLVRECGAGYWLAPLTLILVFIVPAVLGWLPNWLQSLMELYFIFAFYSVTGAIMRSKKLIDEVYIDDPLEPAVETQLSDLDTQRTMILNHAYGFVSRGNREGGLGHIYMWLQEDPDPEPAWSWFFEQMLRWEQGQSALFFAQRYLSHLLAVDEPVKAVKLVLRCQLVDETFRPFREDFPATIDAALHCDNTALADALKRL